MNVEIRVARQAWSPNLDFLICQKAWAGKLFSVAKPVELEEVEADAYTRPTGSINEEAAQQLMDELWKCGLRPSEGTGSAGAMAATQGHLEAVKYHLEDMRRIALPLMTPMLMVKSKKGDGDG